MILCVYCSSIEGADVRVMDRNQNVPLFISGLRGQLDGPVLSEHVRNLAQREVRKCNQDDAFDSDPKEDAHLGKVPQLKIQSQPPAI